MQFTQFQISSSFMYNSIYDNFSVKLLSKYMKLFNGFFCIFVIASTYIFINIIYNNFQPPIDILFKIKRRKNFKLHIQVIIFSFKTAHFIPNHHWITRFTTHTIYLSFLKLQSLHHSNKYPIVLFICFHFNRVQIIF